MTARPPTFYVNHAVLSCGRQAAFPLFAQLDIPRKKGGVRGLLALYEVRLPGGRGGDDEIFY